MNTINVDRACGSVDFERYAAELADWRRDIRNVRAHQSVPETLNTHPKDRALFAHIDAVLAAYENAQGSSIDTYFWRLGT